MVEPTPDLEKYLRLDKLSRSDLRDELKKMEKRLKWFHKHEIPELWEQMMQDPQRHRTETWKKHREDFQQYLGMQEVTRVIVSILRSKHERANLGPFTQRTLKLPLERRKTSDPLTDCIEGVILIGLLRGEGYREILKTLHQGPEKLTEHQRFLGWVGAYNILTWQEVGKNKTTRGLFQKWMVEIKDKYGIGPASSI